MNKRIFSLLVSWVALGAGACGSSGNNPAPTDARGSDAAPSTDANPDLADVGASDRGDAGAADSASDGATDATCRDGACPAAPLQLVAAPGCGAIRLVLAGTTLYWTERATGLVRSLSTTSPGDAPKRLAANETLAGAIAVDDTNVYWANGGNETIMKLALAGGAPSTLAAAPNDVTTLLASAGTVYYGAGPSTVAVSRATGTQTTLMSFPVCHDSTPRALALDATYVYQTDLLHQFLTRGRLDGAQLVADPCAADPTTAPRIAAPDTITHTQGELLMDTLSSVAGQLIWADGAYVVGIPLPAGVSQVGQLLAQTAVGNPVTGFVVSGGNIYLGESGDPPNDPNANAVEVAPLAPGDAGAGTVTATVLAKGQRNAGQFAADDGALYWVTRTPPATVDGKDVASTPTCTADAYGVCCGAVCVPNDCAIMKLAR